MKLYWFQVAPNPTKVRLYISEKRRRGAALDIESEIVKLPKGEQNTPGFLKKNPFGALPVLELDDGTTIIESLPIIDYLEECHPESALWGDSPRQRARNRELERIADVRLLSPVANYIHATDSPVGLPPNPGVAERAQTLWPKPLAYLDAVLNDGRSFLGGEVIGMPDFTVMACLQFARFAKLDLELPSKYPQLAAFDERSRVHPCAAEVLVC